MRKILTFGNDHFVFLHKGTKNDGIAVLDRNFGAQPSISLSTTLNAAAAEKTTVIPNVSNCNVCKYTISAKGGGGTNPQLVRISRRVNGADTQIVLVQTLTSRNLTGSIQVNSGDSIVATIGANTGSKSATVTLTFGVIATPKTDVQKIVDPISFSWTSPGTYNNAVTIPTGYTLADFTVRGASGGAGSGAHRAPKGAIAGGGRGGGHTSIDFVGYGTAGGVGSNASNHTSTGKNAFSTCGGGGAGGTNGGIGTGAGTPGVATLILTGIAAGASVNANGVAGGAKNPMGTDGNPGKPAGGAHGGHGGNGAIITKNGAPVVGGTKINVIVGAGGAAGTMVSGAASTPWFPGNPGQNGSVYLTLRG